MRYKTGYYVVCPAGITSFDIAWTDGDNFYMPGSADPIDLGLMVMMSSEPVDISSIQNVTLVDPFESNVANSEDECD